MEDQPLDQEMEKTEPSEVAWQASEYLHHNKKPGWYVVFALIAAVMLIIGYLAGQLLSVLVFVVMGVALVVYAHKEPRILNYHLDPSGVTIDSKFHPYNQFRSFGVVEDLAWHAIDLEPTKRFMPRMTVLFDSEHLEQIVAILSQHLPRMDRRPDAVERLSRYLKL